MQNKNVKLEDGKPIKILVFLQGTIIMHLNAIGRSREERVKQGKEREESVFDYASYVPVGNAVQKLQKWEGQGAIIIYLSSHEVKEDIEKDESVLRRFGFPEGIIFFRRHGEEYKDIAEKIMPDILIEDDCESIGGEKEMSYPHIRHDIKERIKSIVVKEFEGIDHLPDSIADLKNF